MTVWELPKMLKTRIRSSWKIEGLTILIVACSQGSTNVTVKSSHTSATPGYHARLTLTVTTAVASLRLSSVDSSVIRPVVASMLIPVLGGPTVSE